MLEERRLRALQLLRGGIGQAEVARRLGVTPQAVHYWKLRLKEGGPSALKAKPRPGRPPELDTEQIASLPELLANGALTFGYETDLWTTERVADVIAREWGVNYTNVGVWKLLKSQGFSWQRPRRQAREKDLRAVQNWKRHSWPRPKKKQGGGEPSSSSSMRAGSP